MCHRYTITVLPSDLELWLNVKSPDTYKPRFNAAPNQILPIITSDNPREVVMAHWGFIQETRVSEAPNSKLITKSLTTLKSSIFMPSVKPKWIVLSSNVVKYFTFCFCAKE